MVAHLALRYRRKNYKHILYQKKCVNSDNTEKCSVSQCVGKIGSRVGRNQTTVTRICDRWMQEDMTDRRGRSHLPQCTTSMSARTIQRRLQQSGLSARLPLLGLPLTQNHRRYRHKWCDKRRM
ncbi:transposable element Tcb1 transposase [Trichonephila clavipes]|nr:transposable element Tcb1 transposase [Trichonephila clavipes]